MEKPEPIRVLQIIGVVCGGGVESVIMNYYRHIDRQKVQFDFVINGYNKTLLDDDIIALGGKVYKVEPYNRNIFKYMYQIYRIIRDRKYKIIHCNMNALSVFSLLPAWLARADVRILHNHSTAVKSEIIRSLIKYIIRPLAPVFANRYVACSRLAGTWMYGENMMKSGKVKIINNAIDLDEFKFNKEKRIALRHELGISDDSFVIGHVGRFTYQKNHNFLIDIFNEIYKKKSNSILLLIGDGVLKNKIKEKVDGYHLNNNVKFLGLRNDVKDLYNVMDLFVLPSWYEGLPVVSVEAQANGLKCLLSDMVTKESDILPTTEFISVKDNLGEWREAILKAKKNRDNKADSAIKKSGFDIEKNSLELTRWYQKNGNIE